MDNEILIDKHLNIHTTGRDDTDSNYTNFPYEPTPYNVLDRLANSGYISKSNTLIDFGCGKGRVDIYLSYLLKCHCIGVEYNERIYNKAIANQENSPSKNRVQFTLCNASEFEIPATADRFYFFNPFNVKILDKVINNIKLSNKANEREMLLFFYYPSDKYINYLLENNINIVEEIDCSDLILNDEKEKILVAKL